MCRWLEEGKTGGKETKEKAIPVVQTETGRRPNPGQQQWRWGKINSSHFKEAEATRLIGCEKGEENGGAHHVSSITWTWVTGYLVTSFSRLARASLEERQWNSSLDTLSLFSVYLFAKKPGLGFGVLVALVIACCNAWTLAVACRLSCSKACDLSSLD